MALATVEIKLVNNKIPGLIGEMRGLARKVVQATAFDLVADAVHSLEGPRSGVIYGSGKTAHQASAPGEPPAVDTGALKNAVAANLNHLEWEGDLTAVVSVDIEYAAYLEFGTSRMAPRPYMAPAAERQRPKFTRRMEHVMRQAGQ